MAHDGFYLFTGSPYKKICWKMDEAGALGESALHVCLLNGTSIHLDLAKRLLRNYPALINDIYLSDEFYGKRFDRKFDKCCCGEIKCFISSL